MNTYMHPAGAARAACPKMVGEWSCKQESQISGDERTMARANVEIHAKLSIPQIRWAFLRSQVIGWLGQQQVSR